ncbi:MAG: hypothetical protein HY263_09050 [Chloroflexi bacterium]|nr:hypothetical protein [Chloroflexota bacterium]
MTAPARTLLPRIVDAYRRTTGSRTAIALVLANAIPLVGVLLFGWSLWTILVLYWVENGVVGLWNVPRILLAGGATASAVLRVPTAIFFMLHYGLFWLIHGVFVFALPQFFGGGGSTLGGGPAIGPDGLPTLVAPVVNGGFGEVAWSSVAIGAIALFLSHGASFFFNYLGKGEYLRTTAPVQMGAVYGRVVVLHLTILFGAMAIVFLGAPVLLLVVMVVAKTLFDLGLHLRQHPAQA